MKCIFDWLFKRKYVCYILDNITGKLEKSYLTKEDRSILGKGDDYSRYIFVKVPAVNYKFIHKLPGKNVYKLKLFIRGDNKNVMSYRLLSGPYTDIVVLYNTEDNKEVRFGYLCSLGTKLNPISTLIRLYPLPSRLKRLYTITNFYLDPQLDKYYVEERSMINIIAYL